MLNRAIAPLRCTVSHVGEDVGGIWWIPRLCRLKGRREKVRGTTGEKKGGKEDDEVGRRDDRRVKSQKKGGRKDGWM